MLARLLRNLALGSITLAAAGTLGAPIPTLADTVAGTNIEVTQSGNDTTVSTVDAPKFGNITINDAGSGRITAVADGTANTDAVNLQQLLTVSQVANSGWNIQSNGDAATNVAPGATVQLKNGQNIAVTRNGTDITIASVDSPKFGGVTINDAGSGRITGVANGTGTGDAVNLGQLNQVGSKTDALGSSTAAIFGGGANYDSQTGQINQPSYTINNANGTTTTVHNVGDALKGISVGGIKYFHANSTLDDSKAGGTDAIAIGPESQAEGDDGFAAGHGASIDENTNNGIAIGKAAAIGQLSDSAVAVGDTANIGDSAANAVAIGTQAGVRKNGADAVAVGHSAAADQDAVSIGHSALANTGAVGLGVNARASGGSSVAIGNGAQGSMGGDVAIGNGAGSGSAGTASVDTDNVYLGTQAGAGVANGGHNVAIGLNAGSSRGSDSDENIAIGTAAGSGQTGRGNISIGIGAASGSNTSNESTTIGYNANASQSYAVAVGSNASANGANATAFGYNSTAAGSNSLALGASAQAKYGGSIALGSGSVADQTLDHLSDPAFLTGQQANYTLSVGAAPSGGNPGIVRRISNVAGGSLDNDAVNVAQLKNLEQGVQDIVGAYASINPATGQLQYKRPDGQGGSYDTLDDYLDALTTGNGTPQPAPTGAVMYDSGPNHGHITLDGDGSGGGTRISNVADGVDAGDAVNKGQLDSTINANKTHYFSVNSTDAANRDNAGATGADAIAAGLGAEGVGDHSLALGLNAKAGSDQANDSAIAIGNNADTREAYGVSLGAEARTTGQYANAIGYGARSDGNGSIALGKNANAEQQNGTPAPDDAVAIGTNAHVTRAQGTAIGRGATVQAQDGQAFGDGAQVLANSAVALGTGATADAANAHAQGTHAYAHGADSLASGTGAATYSSNSMALGNGAVSGDANLPTGSTSSDSIAMGTTANVIGDHSIAIGSGNTVGVHEKQPDGSEKLIGNFSGAFGNGNTINQDNTFVLGNAVTATQANSVVLGNASTDRAATTETGVTINGAKYSFAGPGSAANGVVSVGAKGKERQLINVAAGKISADSTDAVNGSQLYSVQDTAQKPITFTGNSGTTPVQLGHTLAVKGASSTIGTYSDANIKTVITSGAIDIQLADAPVFAGMVTAQGFDASGKKITNVAPGTAGTDAVNVSQLEAAAAAVKTHYYSVNTTATGAGSNYDNDGAQSAGSIAMGPHASVGMGLTANSIAIGNGASVTAMSGGDAFGSTVIGYNATNAGKNATVVGNTAGSGATYTTPPGGESGGATLIGIAAGSNATLGYRDTFIGTNAGRGSSAGPAVADITGNNTGIGANALQNTTGSWNAALGGYAVGGNSTGSNNTSVGGFDTGRSVTGNSNVALGSEAGQRVTGDSNIAIGSATGNGFPITNTGAGQGVTGSNNIALGASAGQNIAASNTVSIGNTATASAENAIAFGNGAQASGASSISIGTGNVVSGANSGAFGDPSTVSGTGSYSMGNNNTVANDNTFVIGNSVTTTQDNSVVLGNASSDRAATTETGDTINGTAYTYAGQGSPANGVVSVGAVGAERQIINVAAGKISADSTDAVNGSQLYATNQAIDNLGNTVTANKTHYYSVNATATGAGSNYNNDGATGTDALAAGVDAQASGNSSIAVGQNAHTDQANGIAIGTNAVATGDTTNGVGGAPMAIGLNALADGYEATAVGYKSKAVGNSTTAFGVTATATQYNALAVGNYTFASGSNSAALGSNATASNTNATAVGNGATASGINATALGGGAPFTTQGPIASGDNSVAIGYSTKATSDSAIAMGNGAQATGVNSISIGTGNTVSGADSGAFGDLSTTSGTGSYSVGNHNTIANDNTFVMGNGVTTTQNNSVVLGNASTDRAATTVTGDTINGTAYTYAGQGSPANGVVSVGAVGAERQIINVAAGKISADSTDAVNGSQLYATNQAIDDVSQVANAGWNLSANGGNAVNIKPGATLDVSQGDNIVVTQDATTGSLQIATSMTPSFTSVTTGNTIMNNSGIMISGGANGTVSLGSSGLDNGGNKIINVAPGEISANSTDAVNGSQIHKLTDVLSLEYDQDGDKYFINYDGNKYTSLAAALDSMHWNVDVPGQGDSSSGGSTGSQSGNSGGNTGGSSGGSTPTEIHNGDTVGIVAGNNITVSKSARPGNDGANVTIGLSNDITVNSVTANTVNADQVEIKNGPTINQNGIDMHDKRITNLAPGVDGTDAVNVNQLNDLANNAAHDINRVNSRVTETDHRASAGIAAAIATAGLPQAYLPGKSMFSIAGGTWRGESGYAMGLSTVSDNGQWVLKGTASGSSRGDFGGSVGVGYQW